MKKSINLVDTDKVNIKIAYLNLLQNIINRMSTFSIAMKTASITTMMALLAYSASESVNESFKLWMFFIPWLFFAGYDGYFLRLERAFRALYNNSANEDDISFDDFKIDKTILKPLYEKWSDIISSKPIFLFHITLIFIIVISFSYIKGTSCF